MNLIELFKKIISFFNTSIGIAIIGIIGVIIGAIITYLFNKNFQGKLLKNNIIEKTLTELLEILIIPLKNYSDISYRQKYVSSNIYYYKDKTNHTLKDKIQLDELFREYNDAFSIYEENVLNVILYLETHQIILNEFINYHHKLMLLSIDLVFATTKIRKIYNEKIYVSLKQINLSKKYIDEIINLEKTVTSVVLELQFHMQNLTNEIQNICYSKIFNGIKIKNDENNKYQSIKLVNTKKNSIIDFSDYTSK